MKTILIVDDSVVARMLAKQAASKIFPDSEIAQAADGPAALEKHTQTILDDVDLALVDYHMPEMNGLELAGKLRELRSDLRILLCTANAQEAMAKRANEMDVEVLLKPVTEDKLRQALESEGLS